MARTIDTGPYVIRVQCPACGLVEAVSATLSAVLTRTVDQSQLGVKLGQLKAEHRCGQLRVVDVDSETGEVLEFPDSAPRAGGA